MKGLVSLNTVLFQWESHHGKFKSVSLRNTVATELLTLMEFVDFVLTGKGFPIAVGSLTCANR